MRTPTPMPMTIPCGPGVRAAHDPFANSDDMPLDQVIAHIVMAVTDDDSDIHVVTTLVLLMATSDSRALDDLAAMADLLG